MGLLDNIQKAKLEGDKIKNAGTCPFAAIGLGKHSCYCTRDECALWNPNSESCSLSYKSTCNTIE